MQAGWQLERRASGGASRPVALVVMDGVGLGARDDFDAVHLARTPTLDWLDRHAAFRALRAHGKAVGLPSDKDMGNSEVGHNALGAGRVIQQGASLVEASVTSGQVFEAETWCQVMQRCTRGGGTLHFLGLLSDGNVHSHERHLHALLRRAAQEGVSTVRCHVLLDGRDVQDRSATQYLERLEGLLAALADETGGSYRIASGGGRMVTTMDRYEADWRIVERGWRAHVLGEAARFPSAVTAVERMRADTPGISDQVLPAFVVAGDEGPVGPMRDGDACILFNFRGDRAIQISQAFDGGDAFAAFDRGRVPDVLYAGMTLYDGDRSVPRRYLVTPPHIEGTMGERLAASGASQFAVSETQKYGHVTYFWNGNRSGRFSESLETYVEVPSPEPPFDAAPEMSAVAVTDSMVEAIRGGGFDFLRCNFANGDMVGHTGRLEATIRAVEHVDAGLGRILEAAREHGVTLVVTADHGNADDMVVRDRDGAPRRDDEGRPIPRTSHSLSPVGFWICQPNGERVRLREDLPEAGLANVAATVLALMGFEPPDEFEPSLLEA